MPKKKKQDHIIVAIHVTDRVKQAGMVQKVLTRYGGNIKTRIGLHEPTLHGVSPNGVIILEVVGSQKLAFTLIGTLRKITGVEASSIVFEH
ncbi:MAG: hypothetical protein WC637_13590 [Victivallales bacterium]|jgi:hypothetical protein